MAAASRQGAGPGSADVPGAVGTWVRGRLGSDVLHLDVAGCGRASTAVLDAEVAHLRAEGGGGYRAEALAESAMQTGRDVLAGLVGLAGDDVAFLESAHEAMWRLLSQWPLPPGSRIGTVASDYTPNRLVLKELAELRGWVLVDLPVDVLGRVVDVPRDLDLVELPQVPSQRGIAQPVEEVLRSGVPVVLDVAQSLGQTPVPSGAAAYVGTSRKWLCGPRGVGFAVVDPSWERRLATPPTAARFTAIGARRLETPEAHVAGRLGLGVAAAEWDPALLAVVHARAARLRALLTDSGVTVREPVDEPTGITTVPTPDPAATRAGLLEEGVLVGAVPVTRSADLEGPVLRLSTAAWVTDDDVDRAVACVVRALS